MTLSPQRPRRRYSHRRDDDRTAPWIVVGALLLAVNAGAQTPCELDWNRDGVVDALDLADTRLRRGYFYEWQTLVLTPETYATRFPTGDPDAVDWNGDGRIDVADILGVGPFGFYYQHLAYTDPVYRTYYRQLFPASGCGLPTLGNILERDLVGRKTLLVMPISIPRSGRFAIATQPEAAAHGQAVADFFSEQSHGRLDLRATATPVLDMPRSTSVYLSGGIVDMGRLRADVIAAAAQRGYDVSRYDYGIIVSPRFWTGGGSGFARAWKLAVTSALSVSLAAHELGHTFGWSHAALLSCPGSSPFCSAGYLREDGDHFDVMGRNGTVVGRFGPWKQRRAGWLDDRSVLRVTRSGRYTLASLDTDPSQLAVGQFAALEVRIDELDSWWVYYRGDEPLASDGVTITRTTNEIRGQSVLYDMTPGSPQGWQDAQLAVGRRFNDPARGIAVDVVSIGVGTVEVQVTVPSAVASIPELPVVDVVSPTRHDTVRGRWTFEATAYDPAFGTANGDGIRKVTLRLNGDVMVAWIDDFSPPYELVVDTSIPSIPDGQYRLFVEVESTTGRMTQTIFPLFVDNSSPSAF